MVQYEIRPLTHLPLAFLTKLDTFENKSVLFKHRTHAKMNQFTVLTCNNRVCRHASHMINKRTLSKDGVNALLESGRSARQSRRYNEEPG